MTRNYNLEFRLLKSMESVLQAWLYCPKEATGPYPFGHSSSTGFNYLTMNQTFPDKKMQAHWFCIRENAEPEFKEKAEC